MIEEFGSANVALRSQGSWIGIDIDGVERGRDGHESMARAEADLGALPGTISSGSRGPGTSRILVFRIPVSLNVKGAQKKFERAYGKNVDIIHRGHRYLVGWPSVHA